MKQRWSVSISLLTRIVNLIQIVLFPFSPLMLLRGHWSDCLMDESFHRKETSVTKDILLPLVSLSVRPASHLTLVTGCFKTLFLEWRDEGQQL